MRSLRSHAFTLPYTFFRQNPNEVIPELQDSGFTGINLALNYHASRDFILRQGAQLQYLLDGFHYYKPNAENYGENSLSPASSDHLLNNEMLDSVIDTASARNFDVNAWAVFLHNSAIGKKNPEAAVTNVYGNNFLSELCPSNPQVRGYVLGLTSDLCTRGIKSLAIESLHFHGARHGEHHERFFLEMSTTTEFLLSLCFCQSCINQFTQTAGDALALKAKVIVALKPFMDDKDPWLGIHLTKDLLAQILGPEILRYLRSREESVSSLYRDVSAIAHAKGVTTRFVDQAPLIDGDDPNPLQLSWMVGIDNDEVRRHVDIYEPLIYRERPEKVEEIAVHYKKLVGGEIVSILRPTYPDNGSEESLVKKVHALKNIGISEIDFYLLDTMRPRDLKWIKSALS
jgi:hypothetical protein